VGNCLAYDLILVISESRLISYYKPMLGVSATAMMSNVTLSQ